MEDIHTGILKKNYSKYFKTELKNYLSEEEVGQFLKFRLGDIDYKLPKEFYLRKKIYKFFLVSPFEVKQNIKINLKKKIYLSLLNLIYVIFILRYFRLSLILNKRLIIQNLIDFLILKDFNLSHVKLNNHINNKQEIYDTLKGFTS